LHWATFCCTPNFKKRTLHVCCFDSSIRGGRNTVRDADALCFFTSMYANSFDQPFTAPTVVETMRCPQQANNYDCGIFALAVLALIVQDGSLERLEDDSRWPFSQADMTGLRQRFAESVLERDAELAKS